MAAYPIADDDEWFSPKMRGFRWMCCHCSLVHIVDFRRLPDGRFEMRLRQDARATAAARRNLKKKVMIIGE